jgi:Zn-dependent protease with chaperone function
MIHALTLVVYAVAASTALPRVLRGREWTERAPRLAIALWMAACASVIASTVLAPLVAAIPPSVIGHDLASLFDACAYLLAPHKGDLDGLAAKTQLAMLIVILILTRLAYCTGAVLGKARRERRRHAEMLSVLGRHDGELGAMVVEHGEPIVYCLPGRQGQAVITTGALQSLTPAQVAAVLAHERAHMRGRHHLLLAAADALARAFPGVPLFNRAKIEISRLVELLADDVAARRHPRIHIAAALVGLATGRVPVFLLGAGGETALTRVRRMLNPAAPLAPAERLAGVLAVGAMLAGPTAVALIPGVSSFLAHHCHNLSVLWS